MWLRGPEKKRNKQFLQRALQRLTPQPDDNLNPLTTSEVCLSVVMIGLVLILQPYKQIAHNIIDFLMIFYMALIGGLTSANLNLYVTIGPLFLPFLVLLTYLIYCLPRCSGEGGVNNGHHARAG